MFLKIWIIQLLFKGVGRQFLKDKTYSITNKKNISFFLFDHIYMSVKPAPTCDCPGFNESCFADATTVIPTPTPAPSVRTLVSIADFDTITNGLIANTPFLYNLIIATPSAATTYDAYVFSGGASAIGSVISGNVTVGSPVTITTYGSAASGSGVSAINVPANASIAMSLYAQPSFRSPNLSSAWVGTFTLNWTAATITIASTTSGSNVLANGCALMVTNPTFRCPSSFSIGSLVSGTTYNITRGSQDINYYTNQTTAVAGYAYAINSRKWVGTIQVINGVGVFTTTSGSISSNYWVVTSTATYLTGDPTDLTLTKFSLIGVAASVNLPSAAGQAYQNFSGTDIVYNTFVSNILTPQAIITASLTNKAIPGGSGGIVSIASTAVNTVSLSAATGNAGQTQTTTSFPTGLTDYEVLGVANIYATQYGNSAGVKASSTSGSQTVEFTATTITGALIAAGQGGASIYFYS